MKRPRIFYGWIVVSVSMVIAMVVYGTRNTFPLFYVAFLEEFGWSRAATAFIASLNLLFYGLGGPLAGILADRLGSRWTLPLGAVVLALLTAACSQVSQIWQFYLLFGLGVPLANGLAGYPAMAPMVANWFVKKRGTALGVLHAGMGFSFFLIGTSVGFLILLVGWRFTYVVMAILIVVIAVPLSLLFLRQRPEQMGLIPDGPSPTAVIPQSRGEDTVTVSPAERAWVAEEWTLLKALKTARFWMLFFMMFLFWGFGGYLVLNHQVAFVVDAGYSRTFATMVFGLFGLANGLGHGSGFLCDRLGREWAYTVGCLGAILGIAALILAGYVSHPVWLYAYALGLGFFGGLIAPTGTAISADLFQGKHFGAINGAIMAGFGLGGAIGPWLGGFIFDTIGSYTPAFLISVTAMALSGVLVWLAAPRRARAARRSLELKLEAAAPVKRQRLT